MRDTKIFVMDINLIVETSRLSIVEKRAKLESTVYELCTTIAGINTVLDDILDECDMEDPTFVFLETQRSELLGCIQYAMTTLAKLKEIK